MMPPAASGPVEWTKGAASSAWQRVGGKQSALPGDDIGADRFDRLSIGALLSR